MKGKLVLVPTPIHEELPLEPVALQLLEEDCLKENVIILVEDHKVARQRWIRWGLPRGAIDKFKLLNEHTQEKLTAELLTSIKIGKTIYLLSDSGLPAFCDPGQALVDACHKQQLQVTATPFPNSIALAVALSGFPHDEFYFAGFLPAQSLERKNKLVQISKFATTLVIMDTPYRMQALLKDIVASPLKGRPLFLGTQLNSPDEKLFRGQAQDVLRTIGTMNKLEFVVVIGS